MARADEQERKGNARLGESSMKIQLIARNDRPRRYRHAIVAETISACREITCAKVPDNYKHCRVNEKCLQSIYEYLTKSKAAATVVEYIHAGEDSDTLSQT